MEFLFGNFGEDYGFLTLVLILLLLYMLYRTVSQGVRLSRLEKKYKIFMKK